MVEENKQKQVKVRLLRSSTMPVIYAEGIAQMSVGFPNSRIFLSQMSQKSGDEDNKEETHHLACELVLPTIALIEIAQNILGDIAENKEILKSASVEWAQKINDIVSALPIREQVSDKEK